MRLIRTLFSAAFVVIIVGLVGVFVIIRTLGSGLPDYKQLASYNPPIVTRLHAGDGRLLSE
nr:hypothetical protein [Pseudomonadota bacterium]